MFSYLILFEDSQVKTNDLYPKLKKALYAFLQNQTKSRYNQNFTLQDCIKSLNSNSLIVSADLYSEKKEFISTEILKNFIEKFIQIYCDDIENAYMISFTVCKIYDEMITSKPLDNTSKPLDNTSKPLDNKIITYSNNSQVSLKLFCDKLNNGTSGDIILDPNPVNPVNAY